MNISGHVNPGGTGLEQEQNKTGRVTEPSQCFNHSNPTGANYFEIGVMHWQGISAADINTVRSVQLEPVPCSFVGACHPLIKPSRVYLGAPRSAMYDHVPYVPEKPVVVPFSALRQNSGQDRLCSHRAMTPRSSLLSTGCGEQLRRLRSAATLESLTRKAHGTLMLCTGNLPL